MRVGPSVIAVSAASSGPAPPARRSCRRCGCQATSVQPAADEQGDDGGRVTERERTGVGRRDVRVVARAEHGEGGVEGHLEQR